MSTPEPDYDDEYDDQQPPPQPESQGPKGLRRRLSEVERERDELRAQADRTAELEKEVALHRAKLGELNERQRKAVLATAEDTTPEAFLAAAVDLGFAKEPEPDVPVADLEAHDRIAGMPGGSTPDASSYQAEMAAAETPEEARAVMARYGMTPEPRQ